jgi:hypothetical protein
MARVGIISVDGHVKAPWAAYRDYLDPKWREAYDNWMKGVAGRPEFCHPDFGPEAQWDAGKRVHDLEAQGVVAEILFPNGSPFFLDASAGIEAMRAGNAAYNRWLADLCSRDPSRHLGIARIPILAGIYPLTSFRNAEFLNNEVPGVSLPAAIMKRMRQADTGDKARAEGVRIAQELVTAVRDLVQGVQISAPFGRYAMAVEVASVLRQGAAVRS